MRPLHFTPVTDAEIQHAHTALKRHTTGLTRADLTRLFGSDRRGRAIMAALVERGVAPVITTTSDYHSEQRVYRLARNETELREALQYLQSYRDSFDRRIAGLQSAWTRGGSPQPNLFEGSGD